MFNKIEKDQTVEVVFDPPRVVELDGDSLWMKKGAAANDSYKCEPVDSVKVSRIRVYRCSTDCTGTLVHVKVRHDGPWQIYTDNGFERFVRNCIGVDDVSWSEQGRQQESDADLEFVVDSAVVA